MYKIYTTKPGIRIRLSHKILLIMRLTTVILLASLLQVSAATFGQRINFNRPNAPLKTVLKEIRQQTGFDLYYDGKIISENQKVNVVLKDATLSEALEKTTKGLNLNYEIDGHTIIITSLKEPSLLEKLISRFKAIGVRGRIVNSNGEPVSGATIKVMGTRNFTYSSTEGYFFLPDVPENASIEISYVGYQSKIIAALADLNTIVLEIASNNLQEISVNTGYQSIKKAKMTGATTTVTSQDLEKRYTPNILDNLEGRVPGLVNYKGTTIIRGVSTFNTNARNPLIVVDGLPIEGSLANINPYDVESITVLKDAAAASIYGIRASNGVIVITTKKAKGKGTTIEFGTDITLTDKIDYTAYNYLTPSQQVDVESTYAKWLYTNPTSGAANIASATTQINNGITMTPVTYQYYQLGRNLITIDQLNATLAGYRQNDFRRQYRENALLNQLLQQYNLAIRNIGEKYQSSLVLNYKTDNTGIINAYNKQLNIFYKGTYQLGNRVTFNFGINGILGKIKGSNSSFATSGTNVSPYLSLLDQNGNRMYYTTTDYNAYNTQISNTPQLQNMMFNHLDELSLDIKQTDQYFTRYYANMAVKILPGLTFSPQFQYENSVTKSRAYSETGSYIIRYLHNVYATRSGTSPNFTYANLIPAGGKLATSEQTTNAWTARGQLDYNKQIGKHEISVIGGTEFRENLTRGTSGLLLGYDDQLQSQGTTGVNFPAVNALTTTSFFKPTFNTVNLYNTYIGDQIGIIPEVRQRSNSVYANAQYTYDGKYNIFGSYRKDYADVFGLDEQYRGRPLWSTGFAWILSKEDFVASTKWVSFLKLRGTYGITGNIPAGLSSRLVANSTLPVNTVTQLPVSVVEASGNPLLRWEKTATINVGLDFALFDNRLSGTLDWYRKKSSDVFASTRIDPSEGFTSQIINNGNVLNNGLELSLQYQWFKPENSAGLLWSTALLISHNNNKVTFVDQVANTPQLLTATGSLKTGYPVNSIFSYQYAGINNVGQPQWKKADGSLSTIALTSSDLNAVIYSGGLDPKNNVALTNEFNYKGFSLNILAVYYGGAYQRAVQPDVLSAPAYGAMPSYLLNAWTPTNTNTLVPGYGQYAPAAVVPAGQMLNSETFVVSSDFIKIRSIALGYRLPGSLATKLGTKNIGIRFQVNNPKALWIRNDVDIDPETGTAPLLSSYVFGLNFNL